MDSEAVLKRLNDAHTALKGLEKELRRPALLLNKDKLTLPKGKIAVDKALAYIKKFGSLARLMNNKKFKSYSEEVQGGIVWAEGLMGYLTGVVATLRRFLKMAKKPAEKQAALLVKTTKEIAIGVSGLPKGVGLFVRKVKKGEKVEGPQGQLIALLPMVILLWSMSVTAATFIKSRS
jgi:hypothetical protein